MEGSSEKNCCWWLTFQQLRESHLHRVKWIVFVSRWCYKSGVLTLKITSALVIESCRHLVKAQIDECHRRLNYSNNKLQNNLTNLNNLLDTVITIINRQTNKTTGRICTEEERKLSRFHRDNDKKQPKTDDNWVRKNFFWSLRPNPRHAYCPRD